MMKITTKVLAAAMMMAAAMVSPAASGPAAAEPVPHTVCTTTTNLLTILLDPPMPLLPGPDIDFDQGTEQPSAGCSPVVQPEGWGGQITVMDIDGHGRMACVLSDSTSVDGTIEIEFSDGDEATLDIEGTSITDLRLSPQAGRLVTFTGDVEAQSDKYAGDEFRLIIAVATPLPTAAAIQCITTGMPAFSGTFSLEVGPGIVGALRPATLSRASTRARLGRAVVSRR
jgi:hypothetical protein